MECECIAVFSTFRGRQRRYVITEKKVHYTFCVFKGIPKEERIADGIYCGRITSIRKDRNGNEFPIVDSRYQIVAGTFPLPAGEPFYLSPEKIVEAALSLLELNRQRRWIVMEILQECLAHPVPLVLQSLVKGLEVLDEEIPHDFTEEEKFFLKDFERELEASLEEILQKSERLKKEKRDEDIHKDLPQGELPLF